MRPSLFVLNNLDVKNPCPISSSNLVSNNQGEWCKGCSKQVYDTVKHTKLNMAYLLFSKRGKVCIRIEKDNNKNIIYKPSLFRKSLSNILYFTKFALPTILLTFFHKPVLGQESCSREKYEKTENFFYNTSDIIYGDVRIRDPIGELLVYIEGALGALLMVLFFILFIFTSIVSFFQKDKAKKKRKRIWAIIFLILSIFVFVLRFLVSTFFSDDSMGGV